MRNAGTMHLPRWVGKELHPYRSLRSISRQRLCKSRTRSGRTLRPRLRLCWISRKMLTRQPNQKSHSGSRQLSYDPSYSANASEIVGRVSPNGRNPPNVFSNPPLSYEDWMMCQAMPGRLRRARRGMGQAASDPFAGQHNRKTWSVPYYSLLRSTFPITFFNSFHPGFRCAASKLGPLEQTPCALLGSASSIRKDH
jgi:hypothetical protein